MGYVQDDNPFTNGGQTIAGQSMIRSPKGIIAIDNIGKNIKKGDVIHGVSKYIGPSGVIPQDLDFFYRRSTRKSGGWTVTGHK